MDEEAAKVKIFQGPDIHRGGELPAN